MTALVEMLETGHADTMTQLPTGSSPSRQLTSLSASVASEDTIMVSPSPHVTDLVEEHQDLSPQVQNGSDGHLQHYPGATNGYPTPGDHRAAVSTVSFGYGSNILADLCAKQAARIAELERHVEMQRETEANAREKRLIQELSEACAACDRSRVECESKCEQMSSTQARLQAENQELFAEMRSANQTVEALRREVQLLTMTLATRSPTSLARQRICQMDEESSMSGQTSARQLKSPGSSFTLPVPQNGPAMVVAAPPWGPVATIAAVVAAGEASSGTVQAVPPGACPAVPSAPVTNGSPGTMQRHAGGYYVCGAEDSGPTSAASRSSSVRGSGSHTPSVAPQRKMRHAGYRGASPMRLAHHAGPPPSSTRMNSSRSSAAHTSPRSATGSMSPRGKSPMVGVAMKAVPNSLSGSSMRQNQARSVLRSPGGKRSASATALTAS